MVKNLRRLVCKFDFDQSERKSWQVNSRTRKARSNGVASSPQFLTCVYFRVRLTMLELHSFGEKNLSSLFSYIFVFSRSILRKALTSEKVHKLKAFLTGSNPPKKSNKPSAGLFKARLS